MALQKKLYLFNEVAYAFIEFAVPGGSKGEILGVMVWFPKTMRNKFRYGIPAIILLQAAFSVFCLQ